MEQVCLYSLRHKSIKEKDVWISGGRLFHWMQAATWNERQPITARRYTGTCRMLANCVMSPNNNTAFYSSLFARSCRKEKMKTKQNNCCHLVLVCLQCDSVSFETDTRFTTTQLVENLDNTFYRTAVYSNYMYALNSPSISKQKWTFVHA